MTAPLALVWFGAFTFFLSFFLLAAALPLYARAIDIGDRGIGGVMGAFAFAAMLVRPWAGFTADRRGRRPLMLGGALVFVAASFAYSLTAGVLGLLAVRLFHGCGMGLYPTAASALVADLAPPGRRGAVMGTFGAAATIAMALGPIVGIAVADRLGFVPLFGLAACVGLVSVLLTVRLSEAPRPKGHTRFAPRAMVSLEALVPSAIVFLVMLGYGGLVTFLPIHARAQEVNPGLFFLVFAVVVTAVRSYAGHLSDRLGRIAVAVGGLALAATGLAALALTQGAASLVAVGALYGAGFGTLTTALLAWCVDVVDAAHRGRAMGTYYTALELGIALGSLGSGLAIDTVGFVPTFLGAAVTTLAAATLALGRRRRDSAGPPSRGSAAVRT